MEFTFKNYKIIKTQNYIKKNNIFFFFAGVNRNWASFCHFNCHTNQLQDLEYTVITNILKTIIYSLKALNHSKSSSMNRLTNLTLCKTRSIT